MQAMKRIVFCFISFLLCFPFAVYAATNTDATICTQKESPNTITQTSPGASPWSNISNVITEDGKETVFNNLSKNPITDVEARLILPDGSVGTVDKSSPNSWTSTSQYISYGGDVWNTPLTPLDVDNPNFGFAFQVGGGITQSKVLKLTNFGFRIPKEATITNITVEVKKREAELLDPTGTTLGYVDHVRMFICYTPTTPFPANTQNGKPSMLIARIGSPTKVQAAPGEYLSIPITLELVGGQNNGDIAIQYQIRDRNGDVVLEETDTFVAATADPHTKRMLIPKQFLTGTYIGMVSILSAGQPITEPMKFPFIVEPKIIGVFVSTLAYYGWITFFVVLLLFIGGLWIFYKKTLAVQSYTHIPESERMFYEIIGDMIRQMHELIGDKAYKIADAVVGLTIDLSTGRVLRISKDPTEMIATLLLRYQNIMKKDVKISVRSKGAKVMEHLTSVANTYSTFDKYFRPK